MHDPVYNQSESTSLSSLRQLRRCDIFLEDVDRVEGDSRDPQNALDVELEFTPEETATTGGGADRVYVEIRRIKGL